MYARRPLYVIENSLRIELTDVMLLTFHGCQATLCAVARHAYTAARWTGGYMQLFTVWVHIGTLDRIL